MKDRSPDSSSPQQPLLLDNLSAHVKSAWEAARTWHESDIRPKLIDALERRKGEYPSDKLAAIRQLGGVETFVRQTALKCSSAQAWIRDVFLPPGQKPWQFRPTPVPDLPGEVRAKVEADAIAWAQQAGMQTGIMPSPKEVFDMSASLYDRMAQQQTEEARLRARKMEDRVEDVLVEGNFRPAITDFIYHLTTFDLAVLKGPVLRMRKRNKWGPNGEAIVTTEPIPWFESVSPFDFYPSPESASVNGGASIIHRQWITRRHLEALRGTPSYSEQNILKALMEWPSGMGDGDDTGEQARRDLEVRDMYADGPGTAEVQLLEYWGSVPGETLLEWGLPDEQVPDPMAEYEICAVCVGRHVIKAMLNPDPLGRRPFHVTSYEKMPGTIRGNGIPAIMAAQQDAINATVRAMLDNLSLAGGPQVIVNESMVAPSSLPTINKIWRNKVWRIRNMGMPGQSPISFEQPKLLTNQFLLALAEFKKTADDLTGIPAYIYGNEDVGGAGTTASGLSMLMNAAAKGIRQVIANVGVDVMVPLLEMVYTHVMTHDPDPSIKGDIRVSVSGVLAQLMKNDLRELRQQAVAQATTSPDIMAVIGQDGLARLLRATYEDIEIVGVVPSEDELKSRMAMQRLEQAAMGGGGAVPGAGDGSSNENREPTDGATPLGRRMPLQQTA